MLETVLDITYRCVGCDNGFPLLVGDPRAELCPDCCRAVREDLTADFSAGIIEELGRENAEVPPPSFPEDLYDELVGALLDVQDALSARAPAGRLCRPEDDTLYRRVFAALEMVANT